MDLKTATRRATRDMILDSLCDKEIDVDRIPDTKLATIYDEIMEADDEKVAYTFNLDKVVKVLKSRLAKSPVGGEFSDEAIRKAAPFIGRRARTMPTDDIAANISKLDAKKPAGHTSPDAKLPGHDDLSKWWGARATGKPFRYSPDAMSERGTKAVEIGKSKSAKKPKTPEEQIEEFNNKQSSYDEFLRGVATDYLAAYGFDKTAQLAYEEILQEEEQVKEAAEKIARSELLGKEAARAYAATFFQGQEKIARGLSQLIDKVRGTTPEERRKEREAGMEHKLKMDRMPREQALSLEPREIDLDRKRRQLGLELGPKEVELALAQKSLPFQVKERGLETLDKEQLQALSGKTRELMGKDIKHQQDVVRRLRELQLADQYERRDRERQLFRGLHKRPGTGGLALGGGAAGVSAGTLLRKLVESGVVPKKYKPLSAGALGAAGALGGVGYGILRDAGGGPSRTVRQLERSAFSPPGLTSGSEAPVMPERS